MSYLLTEIALEMLGYKFYDINGIQDEINNFHTISNPERRRNPYINAPNLAYILGLRSTIEPKRSVCTNFAVEGTVEIPNALAKLIDSEFSKVNQQVMRNKPSPLAADGQLDTKTVQMMAKNFVESEREKLRIELKNLQTFRRHIEQVLIEMNPGIFQKYCESFKTPRRATKRSNDGAPKV